MPASRFRKALFAVHLYLATFIGVFISIFGVTGSILALSPELGGLLRSNPVLAAPGQKPLSIAELDARVSTLTGNGNFVGWTMSDDPNESWELFSVGRGRFRVNPYTGAVISHVDSLGFLGWVAEIHVGLRHESPVFRAMMDSANLLAVLVLISGVYLWWPLKRLTVKGKLSGRRFWFDVHNAIGILALLFVLTLSVTGVVMTYGGGIVPLAARFMSPQAQSRPLTTMPPPDGKPMSPDRVLEIARATVPSAVPIELIIPPAIPKATYSVQMRYPSDPFISNVSRLSIDRETGAVLTIKEPRMEPAEARVSEMNLAIHTGGIFGMPGRIVMSLASLMVVVEAASGLVMWWKRRARPRKII